MLQDYVVDLYSDISLSKRTTAVYAEPLSYWKASLFRLKITADFEGEFNIGLICGPSGSGKTSLAKQIFGVSSVRSLLGPGPIIDQLPEDMLMTACSEILHGVGLPEECWYRPAVALSPGERSRAEAALHVATPQTHGQLAVIDEWCSLIDRPRAEEVCRYLAAHARKRAKTFVLITSHDDVAAWLDPDWTIDCREKSFDRRALAGGHFAPSECRVDPSPHK